MTNELWVNLPVKDIKRSKEFFSQLGFSFNEAHSTNTNACMVIGSKSIVVMLFEEKMFGHIVNNDVTDTSKSNEALFSFDAETKEEVDEMANKVKAAGGNLFSPPADVQGWMYGCAFADPDGHRWNVLYMDMEKMPKQ